MCCVHGRECVCVQAGTCMWCVHACVILCTHVYICVCIYMCVYICVCVCVCVWVCVYVNERGQCHCIVFIRNVGVY